MIKRIGLVAWPWLVMAGLAGVATWHLLDFSEARETDFPKVVRPFFNRLPPAAYRLAEPGDTLDRVGLYLAAVASALALAGIACRWRSRPLGLWPAALALSMAAAWHASTPWPTFDGWSGLGWRAILNPSSPPATRLTLAAVALGLAGSILANLAKAWPARAELWKTGRESGIRTLLAAAIVLVGLRQYGFPSVEPAGYWPRVAFDLGILAFGLALIRSGPFAHFRGTLRPGLAFVGAWAALVVFGVGVTQHHRPLARLHAVVPGKIYISAMPSYRGLSIEQERLHFRTIINLFDEASTQASPLHEDEIRFVREHGLRYLGSPSDGLESDRFLDETIALARNPDAWPILVHCHGCMDRSPAWMGIYRFLVEGKPLDEIFREIERHRGSRPKAVVFLQYNRKLPSRAPDLFAGDPTGDLLRRCVAGTKDPFLRPNWNSTITKRRVVTRIDPDPTIRRP